MFECVVNLSEGRDRPTLDLLAAVCGPALLDVHADADHHRSVFTLAGDRRLVDDSVRALTSTAVERLDLRRHAGVHPRIGVVDVVPWVPLQGWPLRDGPLGAGIEARDRFARWAGDRLGLPCFLYGPERSLPEVRRQAWRGLHPDAGPDRPHPTAGAAAVGARGTLIAYNLWLAGAGLATARQLAAGLRSARVRTLGLAVAGGTQVSCNLIDPWTVGPAEVYDAVARLWPVERAELVGLVPRGVLDVIPSGRWKELGLDPATTIEARLEEAGLDGGRTGER